MSRHRIEIVLGTLALVASASTGNAQSTSCVNLAPNGFPVSGSTINPSMSADGRWVAFSSSSTNLIPGSGIFPQIYVRDRATNAIQLASADSSGVPGNTNGVLPSISADGRWVLFSSAATNLVAIDTNAMPDTFLRDLATGTTTIVSLATSGAQANQPCMGTSISGDGRFVVFETLAALEASDTNGRMDVYVRDVVSNVTSRASVSSTGASSVGDCSQGSISADGRRIAFTATADDLVPGDANGLRDIFLRSRTLGTTQIVSVNSIGAGADGFSRLPILSGDGQFVAFISSSTNLVTPATTAIAHVYRRDLSNNATSLVDVDALDLPGNAVAAENIADISRDGRFVAFTSQASNLVASDTNNVADVFLRDVLLGVTVRASLGAVAQQADEGLSRVPAISDDGRFVAFHCDAENMLPADTNSFNDVFVRDFSGTPSGSATCFGDGSGAACPCGNSGFVGRGCGHATDTEGAELFAMGVASVSNDTLRLGARELPSNTTCLFFQGTAALGAGQGVPFGDGLRCVGGVVVRLATKSVTSLQEAHFPGLADAPISSAGSIPAASSTRYYQNWYRSTQTYCTASTFNLTNAVRIDWTL